MNKNIKGILLISMFLILLVAVSGVNAQEVSNDTISLDDNTADNQDTLTTDNIQSNDNNVVKTTTKKQLKTDENTDSVDITNSNYDQLDTLMNTYSTLNFADNFDGKTITVNNAVTLTSSSEYKFTNSNFIVNSNGVTINNLNIENTITDETPVIYVNKKSNVNITNNNITLTKTNTGRTYTIELNQSSYSNVNLNNITVNAYPQNKDWIQQSIVSYVGVGKAAGVVVDDSNYVNVTENNITITNSTVGGQAVSTFEAIAIRNDSTYVSARYNNINASNANYTYGITIERSDRCNATYNTIAASSENYICGIELMEDKHILLSYNNISGSAYKYEDSNLIDESVAYGIYTGANYVIDMTQNVTISYNNINVSSDVAYGIEGYKVTKYGIFFSTYNQIIYNNITVNGSVAMGMGFNQTYYTNINNNIIIVTAYNRTLGYVVEAIPPTTTGIKVIDSSLTINSNHILINENNNVEEDIYSVYLESSSTVQNNYLTSNYIKNDVSAQKTGDDSVYKQSSYSVSNNYAYDLTINTLQSTSKNRKSSGQKIYINNTNYQNYLQLLDSNYNEWLIQNVEEGDYINIDLSNLTETSTCYYALTVISITPNLNFFDISNDYVSNIVFTSNGTIENSTVYHLSIVSLSEDGSLDGITVSVKNSSIHSYYKPYGNYYLYDSHISFDNDSKLLATTIYGDESSNPFASRTKNFYIRLLSKEYIERFQTYDEYLNSLEDPILNISANITGIRGALYKEAQFTSKSSGSNITNVVFNNSTKINIKAKNIKFTNCTFNNDLFIPENQNITFENCTFAKEIQYVYEDDEPVIPVKTIILTKDNYNEYVTNRTLNDNVNEGDTIDIQGTLDSTLEGLTINKPVNIISSTNDGNISLISSKNLIKTNNNFTITADGSGTNITGISFYNTRVTVDGAKDVSIDNITCDTYMESIGLGVGSFSIRNSASNVNVTNSKFYTHGTFGHSTLVIAGASDVLIENNTIIGETDDESQQLGKIGNLFYITSYGAEGDNYNITLRGNIIDASKVLHDNEICNPVRIYGSKITIEDNIIISNDDAVLEQWMSSSEVTVERLIFRNNTVTGRVGLYSTNVLITDNTLDTLIVSNSTIVNNTIKDANIGNDSIIINNTITQSLSIANNTVVEDNTITASLNITSSNITINKNNITTDDEYTITLNEGITDITITNNLLKSMDKIGDESINNNSVEFTCENNTYPTFNIIVTTTEFTIGENATISASIYFGEELSSDINKGKVVFKVNGKTLKDSDNKVIYAKVVNGVASIEGYNIPSSWNKNGITIEAVYSGSIQCEALRSNKTELTINKAIPTLQTNDITATIASTINLTATVTDNDKIINTGKIVFKINGKTVKDENGKVIYAKITNNTVNVEYTLPENFKAKEYTLTATLISDEYDRLVDSKTLTITN